VELNTWLAFMGVILLLIASPGPSAILCVSHGVKFGRQKAIATVLGGAIAALVLMGLSSVGLGAILAASDIAFTVVKVLGAGYLIYLGISTFLDKSSPVQTSNNSSSDVQGNTFSLFKKGFVIGISNPKDLLFFAALFPNFINLAQPQTVQFMTLASSWFVIDCLIMFIYASLGSKITPLFTKQSVTKLFNRCVGSFFMAIGGSILVASK